MELIRRDTDYAVRALATIARRGHFVHACDIARAEKVPFDFLQKILRRLKKAGILKAKRGSGGGFLLAQPPEKIELLAVIEAVQGPVAVNRCFLGEGRCPRQENCPVRDRLKVVQAGIRELLAEVTLDELVKDKPGPKDSIRRS